MSSHLTLVSIMVLAAIASTGHLSGACGDTTGGYVVSAAIPPVPGTIPIDIPAIPGESLPPWVKIASLNNDTSMNASRDNTTRDISAMDSPYNNEISGGQTCWHSATLDAVKSFNVDLKWSDPGDDFRLVIYTPDNKVLGPYDDESYGQHDGEINLNIANPSGVAAGKWYFKITDLSTSGKDEYYIKTY